MDTVAATAMRECIVAILKIGGPVMGATLLVGLLVSVLQAVTQINEATLSFLPKVGVIIVTFMLLGPFFAGVIGEFWRHVFDQIIIIGGS